MSGIEVFDRNRPLLLSISYRMLGSVRTIRLVVNPDKLMNVPSLKQEMERTR